MDNSGSQMILTESSEMLSRPGMFFAELQRFVFHCVRYTYLRSPDVYNGAAGNQTNRSSILSQCYNHGLQQEV